MPTQSILEALAASGYGRLLFTAGAAGELAHTLTVLHFKPLKTETIPAFLRRLQQQAQPGDEIELVLDQGALQLARITRSAAAATR